ncbi:transposase, partial [Neisseria meningitidis]|nr:transposase [Neisseria meningitidis]
MFGFRLSGGKGILQRSQVALVVMESTGGLEIPAAKAIRRAGIAVIIANPRQTHQFAQSQP